MNKKNLIIEVVLGIIVLWLLADQYMISDAKPQKEEKKQGEAVSESGLRVAYINTDSLLLNYKLAKELNRQFTDQKKQSQRELDQRMRTFQKNYQDFQEKVQRGGFLSQSSAEAQQQELLSEQQELEKLNQQLTNGLMAKEQSINQELYDSVSTFVRHYNKKHNYDLILNNTMGGSLIFGKSKFNITAEVLQQLNKRYERRMD